MGKHCTQEMANCIQDCIIKYGDSWTSTFCVLDCELTFATCVIRDFSRALQGEELAQATQTAEKMDRVGKAYIEAAASIRSKTSIGFTKWNVVKRNGDLEPFYPEAKLLPSVVAAGADPETARIVTNQVVRKFQDGMSSTDLRAEVRSSLETINPAIAARYAELTIA